MMKIKHSGNFKNIQSFFDSVLSDDIDSILAKYGEKGLSLLEESTPKRTGLTSRSWRYGIEKTKNSVKLCFYNDNVQQGQIIAILIQYGFVTSSGYKVNGRDYINPVTKTLFDDLADNLYKEVNEYAINR